MLTVAQAFEQAMQRHRAGELAQAEQLYLQILQVEPGHTGALHLVGLIAQQRGQQEQAAVFLREALRLRPDFVEAHYDLGNTLREQGLPAEAAECFVTATRLRPGFAEAYNNLGICLDELGRRAEALVCYQEVVRLRPNSAHAFDNLGHLLRQDGRFEDAAACHQEAIRLDPTSAHAHNNLGNVLRLARRPEEAAVYLEKALALQPDLPEAFASLFQIRALLCDWRHWDADLARLDQDVERRLAAGRESALPPFFALALPWSPQRQRAIAQSHADAVSRRLARERAALAFTYPRSRGGRLRLGYLSADFHNHATMHLMQSLLGLHERREFEVFAYSYGPDDGSDYRRRAVAACDHFREVLPLSASDSARLIHADGIHILVELKGFTTSARPGIAALRPAPLQVNFLGYVSTLGADYIDYLIADPVVAAPAAAAAACRESLVLLPDTCMVTDHEQPIAATAGTRAENGLPETGFVFCCFNNTYKIQPHLFDAWMRILAQAPGSVLWLLAGRATVQANLRREAAARGIDPARLVFAERLEKPAHLARHRLADLFLDTDPYNAHTTGVDALWAGVPLLTCPGETFVSRVAASLLSAAGLPELIVPDHAAYERLAVRFAQAPAEVHALRARLAAQRLTCPLFDTPRFTRNLERAYHAMWDAYAAGRAPSSITC